jgi:hypothetical protein
LPGPNIGAAPLLAFLLDASIPTSPTAGTSTSRSVDSQGIMGKAKAEDKGNEKGGPAAKGKAKAADKGNEKGGPAAKGKGVKSKSDGNEDKGGKVKGAQQINVRHVLVGVPLFSLQDGRQ